MDMKNNCELLIVSPHCDDACFSLGASILKHRGRKIMVWDIFTIQSYTLLHNTDEEAKERILIEEDMFREKSGVSVLLEELPDAYLRGYKRLSNILLSNCDIIESNEKELEIVDHMEKRMNELYQQLKPKCIAIPLGVGAHIDHLIVREGILNWYRTLREIEKPQIFFYEELPYSMNSEWLKNAMEDLQQRNLYLEPYYSAIDEYIDEKILMANFYKSQIKEKESEQFGNYAKSMNPEHVYERIWMLGIGKKGNNGCSISCSA